MPVLSRHLDAMQQCCRGEYADGFRLHRRAVEEHVALMDGTLRQERERRKQLQTAAVAYETLRLRVLALRRVLTETPSAQVDPLTLDALLAGLPRTLNG
jgi:hypothetical protein